VRALLISRSSSFQVSIYLAVLGAAPLIWAPLSGYWGRRIVYLVSLPLFVAGSVGCALCNDLPSLIGTRILQGIGSSAVLAVGAGTIGDIFGPLERATAMGLFYLGAVMGPAFAPVVAGVLQEYTKPGWRSMQWLLAAAGTLSVTLIFFFLCVCCASNICQTCADLSLVLSSSVPKRGTARRRTSSPSGAPVVDSSSIGSTRSPLSASSPSPTCFSSVSTRVLP
jgi:multidrug resistance protein